jgi:hypothetical protein
LSTPQSYIEELDLQFHTLLTSAVGRTDWWVSGSCRFIAGTIWIGGSVGSEAGLDFQEERGNFLPFIGIEPRIVQSGV